MQAVLGDWVLTLKNLLLPIFCKQCGCRVLTEENGFFCPTCWEASPRVQRPFCTLCGRPHKGAVGFGTQSNFPCADCREKPLPHVRRVYGAAVYDGAIKEAIGFLKFQCKPHLARPLAEVMTAFAEHEMDGNSYDYIVPIPLHATRERDRGFNQSALLARALMPTFSGAQLDHGFLRRIRATRIQSRLSEAERRKNVRGAFEVQGEHFREKNVILVDDVVTTGSTVSECARALRAAGAKSVDVFALALVVARTMSD